MPCNQFCRESERISFPHPGPLWGKKRNLHAWKLRKKLRVGLRKRMKVGRSIPISKGVDEEVIGEIHRVDDVLQAKEVALAPDMLLVA